MTRLRSLGLLVSVSAAATLLAAPAAFADGGHGDRNRGRDGDEHVLVVNTGIPAVQDVDDDDLNEDRDELQVAPAQPRLVVEVEQEVNDLDDDD